MEKKCLNCDFLIQPEHKYCPSCSQRTSEKVTLRSLFANSIATYFSLDSRLFNTLLPLLIRPGKVAKEFIAGKRKTYLYPVQSYLFFALLFLLAFELLSPRGTNIMGDGNDVFSFSGDTTATAQDSITFPDTLINLETVTDSNLISKLDTLKNIVSFENKINHFGRKLDSLKKAGVNIQTATSVLTENDSGFWKFLKSQIIKITYSGSNSFLEAFLGNTPFTLLFFLPFLALFQYLFGNKKKYNIASHFVFHLYNLSFAFMVLLILYIIDYFTEKSTILFSLGIIPIYLFLALFQFYGKKLWRNILRFLLLSFFSLVIGFPIIFSGTLLITFLRY
jgi:hypothetical protein